MIKIISARYMTDYNIELIFSTNEVGIVDFSYLLDKHTVLTEPIIDKVFFSRFFLEFGALCWSNGLELSTGTIYQRLKDSNNLKKMVQIA